MANPRILSQPCEVLWAGFRSNTYALQQAGWEIAIEQDFESMKVGLLMRHQDFKLYAISDRSSFDFYSNLRSPSQMPVFRVAYAAPRLDAMRLDHSVSQFKLVDAAPMISHMEYASIEDLGIFSTPLARTEELIVEPADVATLLEQIRRMQAPGQAEIRAKERAREQRGEIPGARPMQQFHAQIITLDRRAA